MLKKKRHSLLNSASYRRYVLSMLFLVAAINLMDRQIFGILIEPIKAEFGVSDSEIGILAGFSFALFHCLAGIPIARLADTRPRRLVISAGIFAWSLLTLLSGMVSMFWQLVIARLGVGVGEAAGTPPSHSLISDYYPMEQRASALGLVSVGASAGVMVAFFAGGWINEFWGWRTTFIVLGIPGLVVSLLIYSTLLEPPRGRYDSCNINIRQYTLWKALGCLFTLPAYRHMLVSSGLHGFVTFSAIFWYPAFLHRVHGMSSGELGTALALLWPISTAAGMVLSGRLVDKLVARDVKWYGWGLAIANISTVPFLLLFLLIPSRFAVAFIALIAFVSACGIPAMHAVMQALARPEFRALSSAINVAVINLLGLGIGAATVGILNDFLAPHFGDIAIRYSLLTCVIAAIWAGAHALLAARTLPEDMPAGRHSHSRV